MFSPIHACDSGLEIDHAMDTVRDANLQRECCKGKFECEATHRRGLPSAFFQSRTRGRRTQLLQSADK